MATQIEDATGAKVERLSGAIRFETATKITKALPSQVAEAAHADAADADSLGGVPAADYALRSGQCSLLGRVGPLAPVMWDYEDNLHVDPASLTVEVGDECGDGSTTHDLRVDVHIGHDSGSGTDSSSVSFRLEDNFQIAANFAYSASTAGPVDSGTIGGPTFLEGVGSGSHTIRLTYSGSSKGGVGNGRAIYLTVFDFAVTDLGWTCGA